MVIVVELRNTKVFLDKKNLISGASLGCGARRFFCSTELKYVLLAGYKRHMNVLTFVATQEPARPV